MQHRTSTLYLVSQLQHQKVEDFISRPHCHHHKFLIRMLWENHNPLLKIIGLIIKVISIQNCKLQNVDFQKLHVT